MSNNKTDSNGFLEKSRLKLLWTCKTELLVFGVLCFAFGLTPTVIRWFAPTAGEMDPSYLQFFALAPVGLLSALLCFWLVQNLGLTRLDKWFDGDYEELKSNDPEAGKSLWRDFFNASGVARLAFFAAIFATVMLTYGLIAIAVLQSG